MLWVVGFTANSPSCMPWQRQGSAGAVFDNRGSGTKQPRPLPVFGLAQLAETLLLIYFLAQDMSLSDLCAILPLPRLYGVGAVEKCRARKHVINHTI